MKIAKIGIPLAVLGSIIGLGASDAAAVARAVVFPAAFFNNVRIETDNNDGDSGQGIFSGAASPPTVRAEIFAGAVNATTSILNNAGNVVGGCTVTDPAPANGSGVTFACTGSFVGAVAIQVRVN